MRNERNDKTTKRHKIRKQIWIIPAAAIAILAAAFLIYAGRYYHAGTVAQAQQRQAVNKCLSLVQMD